MTQPMIIDSFAGGGGASTGIELALGRSPDVAINHSAAALALHAANHPETLHLDSNIWDVEPRQVTQGRKVGLLWASPDCKHFSKAKGGAPKDRNIRDLAWVIVRWAQQVKPDVILMENVEEFRTWGPIDNEGQPIREFEGQTFLDWTRALKQAGYRLQWRELRACDYGAPTIRKRFFMIARRDGLPIVWPKPSHDAPDSAGVKSGKLKPWRTAAECIDWTLPCPSIFDSAEAIFDQHALRAIRPLKPNTLARVARGVKRYVLDAAEPFLVNVANSKTTGRGPNVWPEGEPLRTVTSSNGFALVSPSITRFNGGATGWDLRDPAPTVLAKGGPLGIIAPALATFYGHGKGRGVRAADLAEPLRTITVENRHALISSSLIQIGYREATGQAPRILDIKHPLGTVVAGSVKHALVAPHIATMRNAAKPFNGAGEPTHTITAGGARLTLVAPTLAGCGGRAAQSRPRGADEPFATVTAKADTCLATAFFAKYYGTADGSRMDAPIHTITVKDRMAHVQASLHAPTFGPEHHARAREVAAFLRDQGAWDGGEFVTLTLHGETFVITDIGMRMLSPRELFNAQGFPPDYVIEGVWNQTGDDWTWQPFPKNVQVSCCGNSVCPDLAQAIVTANCGHLIAQEVAA